MKDFLRLRHKMLPYLYTMNYRQYAEKIPMILPMYYAFPREWNAYQVPNQFLFGSQMMVAAITTPCISGINLAKTTVWFPEGKWYDIFTGMCYHGGRKMNLYRGLSTIPVFAKAGAMIPFQEDYMEDTSENPKKLHLYIYTGEDGSFTLYEDDNQTAEYQSEVCVKTTFRWIEAEGCLLIGAANGVRSLIPAKRDYTITFCGIKDAQISVDKVNLQADLCEKHAQNVQVTLSDIPVEQEIRVCLTERVCADNDVQENCFQILDHAEIPIMMKENAFRSILAEKEPVCLLGELLAQEMEPDLYGALVEIITA